MKELAEEVGIVPATLVLYKSDKHQMRCGQVDRSIKN